MSGGSFDYLCYRDASNIFDHTEQLNAMIGRLEELGYQDIALDTRSLFNLYHELNNKINRLSPVWKAVEWMDSGDSGREYVEDETKQYRKNQTT